jgi:flagellar biosynthesis/type III secretory pathway protein FliH
MTKQDMTALLRSVGVSENTVTAMENAYEIGYECGLTEGVQQGKAEMMKDLAGGEA